MATYDRLAYLRALTPAEVWAQYVGSTRVDDLYDHIDWTCPDADYNQIERNIIVAKLEAHRASQEIPCP